MKRFFLLFVCLLLVSIFCFSSCSGDINVSYSESDEVNINDFSNESDIPTASVKYEVFNHEYMKAVWLSQFDMKSIYQSNGMQRSKIEFQLLLTEVFDNLKKDGYNTVIVQVRPYADSFYPSDFYPISNFVSGKFGVEDIYDPFEILIDLAHKNNFSVHAWLNPMRAMTVDEIVNVPEKYLIKQWYTDSKLKGKLVVELNGRLYLNPAYEEVRMLIANGAKEVCENYDIDGVHIDDYFYPTTDPSFDKVAYNDYLANGGSSSLDKFRNEMLDLMVSSIYNSIKSVDTRILFGVSPAGNINNTYNVLYADVYKWCSNKGYLDYICPQIYFGLEHSTYDFVSVYNTWKNIIKNDDIRLVVGMTLGKAKQGYDNYAGDGKYEWTEHKDIIKRCLEYIEDKDECTGISIFCYQYMYDPLSGVSVNETKLERENMKNILINLGND